MHFSNILKPFFYQFPSRFLTIVGSKIIRPNIPYIISINTQNLKATDLTIKVEGTNESDHKEVSLSGTGAQTLLLEVRIFNLFIS
jgi:hypothetical protein